METSFVVWIALVSITEVSRVGSFVHLLTRGQQMVVDVGESVSLECEFYTDDFNLFDNPILWRKTQLYETTQMNMMGNLMEPYSSAGRFRVSFDQQSPRYILGLTINGVRNEDSGNYTCEVNGPHNMLLGFVTHHVYVRSSVQSLLLLADNSTDYWPSRRQSDQMTYTESRLGVLRCVSIGGYPPADLAVFLGRRDITAEMGQAHTARLNGSRGLRNVEYTAERTSYDYSMRAGDDGKQARCVASVTGLPPVSTNSTIVVNYAPIITCDPGSAYIGEPNAFLRCNIRARPWVTALYWMLDLNGTTIGKGEAGGEYWTKVMDRSDGMLETTLYMRQAKQENFRTYSLIVENNIAAKSQQTQLVQKFRTTPPNRASPRSSNSRKAPMSPLPPYENRQLYGSDTYLSATRSGAARFSRQHAYSLRNTGSIVIVTLLSIISNVYVTRLVTAVR